MTNCNQKLHAAGLPHPRTCARCILGPCSYATPDDSVTLKYREVADIIKSEPEYPEETATDLKQLIKEAVAKGDEAWLLAMFQQAVRQTKQCILEKIDEIALNE